MDTVSKMNNNGARCLETHEIATARDLFRGALTMLVGQEGANFVDPPCQDTEVDDSLRSISDACRSPLVDASVVYTQAIPIPHSSELIAFCPITNSSLLMACSIFNLGLVYHLKGLHSVGNLQVECFERALSLYNKAACLSFAEGIGCYVGKHPVIDLLSMAVLNNLSHVSHELHAFERTRSCIENLLQVATNVQPERYLNSQVADVLGQAKQIFCLNTFVFQPPTLANAA
eukprot:Nitzschia sp. Nitz4//scaffold17_size182527//84340//85032//NITZ4_001853-RA/size182527-processed-gene-0.16-mRNA-1//1//CDS//3329539337//132//frame0